MKAPYHLDLPLDLERHVQVRTNWRVRNLAIEVGPDRAVLRGQATTNFTRQLAQHAVQDLLPHMHLENAIDVDNSVEFLLGLPTSCEAGPQGQAAGAPRLYRRGEP